MPKLVAPACEPISLAGPFACSAAPQVVSCLARCSAMPKRIKQMFFNIASGSESQGMQCLAWATFTDTGNSETLALDLQAPTGLINI